jgi:hypothetical protein
MERTYCVLRESNGQCADIMKNILVIPSQGFDHSNGHQQTRLLLAVIKLILQSFECLVSQHLHHKREQVAHVSWSLNIIVTSHYHHHFVLGGSWCHSCMIGRNVAQQANF